MLRDDVQEIDDFAADSDNSASDDADVHLSPESQAVRNKHLTQLRRRAEDILERKRLREALGEDADFDF